MNGTLVGRSAVATAADHHQPQAYEPKQRRKVRRLGDGCQFYWIAVIPNKKNFPQVAARIKIICYTTSIHYDGRFCC